MQTNEIRIVKFPRLIQRLYEAIIRGWGGGELLERLCGTVKGEKVDVGLGEVGFPAAYELTSLRAYD